MQRILISITGCVQGVGFRPFVYRLAQAHHLVGHILNNGQGVMIDVQGAKASLEDFQKDILAKKPPQAAISEIAHAQAPLHAATQFEIKMSDPMAEAELPLLPDTAICQQCLQELLDPHNRRYQYPFLHCVACGPRFSIFWQMPFDRVNTSMADFHMCAECLGEYHDPLNRRFYSQTNCCAQCGPQLSLLDKQGKLVADKQHALAAAAAHLQQGKIIAIKNTGGYQLLVDATDQSAVSRLRTLKQRAAKPFALLMPSLDLASAIAHVCPLAEAVLTSPAAPIVLLKKRPESGLVCSSVAPETPYYGIMLPHNALQHLLLVAYPCPLVATSGNLSDNPICIDDSEALAKLACMADLFLVHNRPIRHRLDDSIVHLIGHRPMLLRRARGYIPHMIPLPAPLPGLPLLAKGHLFAAGSQQKNSFAFKKNHHLYLSQHIGNLDTADACQAYDREVEKWEKLLCIQPAAGIGDQHPDYYTSHYLRGRNIPIKGIQHHQAHVYAGMLDNQLSPPLFGVAWDGTGFGSDQTIWGGEAFVVHRTHMQRFASLYPFRLPGAGKAIREPRRAALGALHALCGGAERLYAYDAWLKLAFTCEELQILPQALQRKVNAPLCSSVGRLFDAVSALLFCCTISHYEGHAALALEAAAEQYCQRAQIEPADSIAENDLLVYDVLVSRDGDMLLLDWRPMLKQIYSDKLKGVPVPNMALAFHNAMAQSIVKLALLAEQENVLLTGGVMQNKLLVEKAIAGLKAQGFKPHWHQAIPPNDGGLCVGQIMGSLV